jgi:hypothetical protein
MNEVVIPFAAMVIKDSNKKRVRNEMGCKWRGTVAKNES